MEVGSLGYKLAILPVKIKACNGSNIIQTYAFLDPGSSATFCTESLPEKLHVRGRRTEFLLRTMGQERPICTYRLDGLEVSSLDSNNLLSLPEVFTLASIPIGKENIPTQEDIQHWPYLKKVSLNTIEVEVGMLIGVNAPKLIEPWRVINSQGDGPYAVLTQLVWLINGPLGRSPSIS